jgi:hypothetical protein
LRSRLGCGEESVDIEMGEKGERTIEKVEQTHKQLWTQENCKIDLRIGLTTNSIGS